MSHDRHSASFACRRAAAARRRDPRPPSWPVDAGWPGRSRMVGVPGRRRLVAVLGARSDQQVERRTSGSGVDAIPPATPEATGSIRSSSMGRCSCSRRTIRSWRSTRSTGEEKWSHRNEGAVTDRGINYWESADRTDRRLLYLNAGSLTAIDARTGNIDRGVRRQRTRRRAHRPEPRRVAHPRRCRPTIPDASIRT